MNLRDALTTMTKLWDEIAAQIDEAAHDADVELVLETTRQRKPEDALAQALVERLITLGWSFTPPTASTDEKTPEPAKQETHELVPNAPKGPTCSCGYAPRPPQAPTPQQATAQIKDHINRLTQ